MFRNSRPVTLPRRQAATVILVVGVALWLCGLRPGRPARPKSEKGPDRAGAVQIQMENVDYRLTEEIILEIRRLRGELERTRKQTPVTFDDSNSFTVQIDTAEVAMTPGSLTALMNSYVLAYPGAPIRNVSVSIDSGRLVLKGTIHKGFDMPVEIKGSLSATEDGNIRVHADQIKAEHIPFKGLLHFLGEDLAEFMHQEAGRGLRLSGDDIILVPSALTPPPHLDGHITRVALRGGKVVQFFGSNRHLHALKPPLPAKAYIYHMGGVVRFGKLTMNDADLEIVGSGRGIFDFFQREYQKQLVAGYSKNTRANGLIVHMADYSAIGKYHRETSAARTPASAIRARR